MIRLDYNIKGFIVTVTSSSLAKVLRSAPVCEKRCGSENLGQRRCSFLFSGNTNMNVPCGESSDFNQDLNPGPPSYWPCQCYKRWVTET